MGGGWIVDVDLRKFFDTIDHGHLREFLKRRVRDGVILRLIGKWLNAGVLEEGVLTIPDDGTPQGGVISPLLANIFLHYVLDEWFEKEVRPRLKGEAFLIRYADDFVIGVAREDDARRIMEVLPKRMSKYGLTVHPEKTRLVRFQPPEADDSDTEGREPPDPRTFDFLGFTHYWGRSQRGAWVVKRKTAKSRLKRALQALSEWCRKQSASADQGSAPEAHAEAARPLRVLRDHWQLRQPPGFPGGSAKDLAALAVSATPRRSRHVARVPSSGEAIQSSHGPSGPRPAEPRSEVMR